MGITALTGRISFDLKLVDCGDWAGDIGFRVFDDAMAKPRVKAIVIPGSAEKITRKQIDELDALAKQLAWQPAVTVTADGFATGAKFLAPHADRVREALGAQDGDLILFGADTFDTCLEVMGELRLKLGRDLDPSTTRPGNSSGWSTSPCLNVMKTPVAGKPSTTPSPAPCRVKSPSWNLLPAIASQPATTWSATDRKLLVVPCGSTTKPSKPRCLNFWDSTGTPPN